jgi:hypothetical protein
VGWPSEPTPSRLETTDCSALLLHPTETVRRRLLARASLTIYLTTLGPATDRDSQVNPVAYSYKIACSILILLHTHQPSSSPHSITTPLRTPHLSPDTYTPSLPNIPHTPQPWYVSQPAAMQLAAPYQTCSHSFAGFLHDCFQHRQCKLHLLACPGQLC